MYEFETLTGLYSCGACLQGRLTEEWRDEGVE